MDVVGSTYPSFEHPAAPDRNVVSLANIVDFPAFEVATDATGFDIDDPGCVRLKGVAGVLQVLSLGAGMRACSSSTSSRPK